MCIRDRKKYLGPIGAYIIAEKDGFYGAGVGISPADVKALAGGPVEVASGSDSDSDTESK